MVSKESVEGADDSEKEVVFSVGGHEVVEDASDGASVLRCIRCGFEVPLTEAERMASQPCGREVKADAPLKCSACSAKTAKPLPSWNVITMAIEAIMLCDGCSRDWLLMLRKGPEIRPRVYGRARGYYFQPLNTWFEEIAGAWPCPACDQFYDRFIDVVNHFAERHPDKASSKVEEVTVEDVKAYRCWQGLYCGCGWLCENERQLLYHYRREHG